MNDYAIVCCEVQYGSREYHNTVNLRNELLRTPLKLSFSPEELIKEKDSFHLICWDKESLAACLVLKPLSAQIIRMRQLAVAEEFQGRGFGKRLVSFAESFAKQHGYLEISTLARETAVGFYEKLGYIKEGDRFIEVTIPHFLMRRILE